MLYVRNLDIRESEDTSVLSVCLFLNYSHKRHEEAGSFTCSKDFFDSVHTPSILKSLRKSSPSINWPTNQNTVNLSGQLTTDFYYFPEEEKTLKLRKIKYWF